MVQHYREMVDDPLRIRAFRDAIRAAVRPGERVAEIGCGLGTYAVFAAQAGAGSVVAVDDGPVIEVAREIVAKNGVADRVQLVAGRSTDVPVAAPVDLVIYEDYASGLLTTAHAAVLRDLRARWLAPGGRLLPARARLWSAPFESRDTRSELDRFAEVGERVLGVDVSPARRRAMAAPLHLFLKPAALLADPALGSEIALVDADLHVLSLHGQGTAKRDGVVHGLCSWFALELPPTGWLGTGPLDPPSPWRQLCVAFDPPLRVAEGTPMSWQIEAAPLGEGLLWRWRLQAGDAKSEGHSLDALLVSKAALEAQRPDHVPQRTPELELEAAILALVDGTTRFAELCASVRARFPQRFASEAEVEARVARVLGRVARR